MVELHIVDILGKGHYVYFLNVNFRNYNNPDYNSGVRRLGLYPLDRGRSGIHPSEVGVRLIKLSVATTGGRRTLRKLSCRKWCI